MYRNTPPASAATPFETLVRVRVRVSTGPTGIRTSEVLLVFNISNCYSESCKYRGGINVSCRDLMTRRSESATLWSPQKIMSNTDTRTAGSTPGLQPSVHTHTGTNRPIGRCVPRSQNFASSVVLAIGSVAPPLKVRPNQSGSLRLLFLTTVTRGHRREDEVRHQIRSFS